MKRNRRSCQGMTRRDFVSAVAALGAAAGAPGMLTACAGALKPGNPDAIFHNGRIVTLDGAGSMAGAVAVKDGAFSAVGSDSRIRALAGAGTRLVDLEGKTVVPGLIDAHSHPMETAMMEAGWVDCRYPGTTSVAKALQNIADWIRVKSVPAGKWVHVACSSASQNKFREQRLMTREELDAVAPGNPVAVANGAHMTVINSSAIATLGIRKGQARLKNGATVQLDANGNPTGVLTDAMGDIPLDLTASDLRSYYTGDIQRLWNQHGFTSVMAITPDTAIDVLRAIAGNPDSKPPSIRYTVSVWASPNGENMPADVSRFAMPAGADRSRYRFAGIKVWVDGENDARTGYMYDPYVGQFSTDPPGNRGTVVTEADACSRFVAIASRNRVIPMLHVSGDRAMDMGLDAYEALVKAGQANGVLRLEHFGDFQMSDAQLQRAKALVARGLRINVQPNWMLNLVKSDYANMGAARTETGFNFRNMIDAGLEPSAGCDMTGLYPENINPFLGIYAAVTRDSDSGPFLPQQAISITEALKMWTLWAAKSMGEGDVKGTIEVGKYADMTVLSKDVLAIAPADLRSVTTVKTIVGGEVVYSST